MSVEALIIVSPILFIAIVPRFTLVSAVSLAWSCHPCLAVCIHRTLNILSHLLVARMPALLFITLEGGPVVGAGRVEPQYH